jgi:hypothetical protein
MKRIAPLLILCAVVACGKPAPPPPPAPTPTATPTATPIPPVAVSAVTIGNAITDTKTVAAPLETLGVKDTIYASVETKGTGHAKVRALWSFVKGDKTAKVEETTIEYDATGPAVTNEFHISKPSGWPAGDYKLEIFLNDAAEPAVTKTFKVA